MHNNNTYSPEEIAEILREYIYRLKFSQSLLAQKIGISTSSLSQVMDGKYKYDPTNSVWIQIKNFVDKIDCTIYKTKVYVVTHRILSETFEKKKISVITSGSGAGKTTSIEQYCLVNPFAIFIRVNEFFTNKYLLEIMMRSVGKEPYGLNMSQMFEALSNYFVHNQKLFIFDEAERLKVSQLEALRDFYDQGNIGLSLVGLNDLRNLLKRGRNLRENLVQLYSRVAYQDVVDFLEPADIKMLFKDKLPGNKVSNEMLKHLAKKYEKQGGFRSMLNLAEIVLKVLDNNKDKKVEIDDDLISDSEKYLFV
jgi:DNA transposition AAA+ family ATPase